MAPVQDGTPLEEQLQDLDLGPQVDGASQDSSEPMEDVQPVEEPSVHSSSGLSFNSTLSWLHIYLA